MATELEDRKNGPVIVSNKIYEQPQQCSEIFQETTGVVLYANEYAGIQPVPMPVDFAEALNDGYGEVGNNVIIQLQQKVQQFADGPWYVESKNGVIHIHNKKLQEPPRVSYEYQSGNGEVLGVNFETQYITKTIHATASSGLGPDKDFNVNFTGINIDEILSRKVAEDYISNGKFYPQMAVNDFLAGKTTYKQLLILNDRFKAIKGKNYTLYTQNQWNNIKAQDAKNKEVARQKQRDRLMEIKKRYTLGDALATDNRLGQTLAVREGIEETLRTKDLTENVQEFLATYGFTEEEIPQAMAEMDAAAQNGTLDDYIKKYEGLMYRFEPALHGKDWQGADLEYYDYQYVRVKGYNKGGKRNGVLGISGLGGDIAPSGFYSNPNRNPLSVDKLEDIDKNPNWIREGDILEDGTVKVYMKVKGKGQVSGYRLLSAYYSSKYGYDTTSPSASSSYHNRMFNATSNRGRTITEKKLNATLTVIGRPSLAKGHVITLNNVGKRWSGNWEIVNCTHNMDPNSGYTTQMQLVKCGLVGGETSVRGYSGRTYSNDSRSGGSDDRTLVQSFNGMNLNKEEGTYYNSLSDSGKARFLAKKSAQQRTGDKSSLVGISGSVGLGGSNITLKERDVKTTKQDRRVSQKALEVIKLRTTEEHNQKFR